MIQSEAIFLVALMAGRAPHGHEALALFFFVLGNTFQFQPITGKFLVDLKDEVFITQSVKCEN